MLITGCQWSKGHKTLEIDDWDMEGGAARKQCFIHVTWNVNEVYPTSSSWKQVSRSDTHFYVLFHSDIIQVLITWLLSIY